MKKSSADTLLASARRTLQ